MSSGADHRFPAAVYIHIPFCTNKCFYCDFNSYVLQGQPVDDYLHALEIEMDQAVADLAPARVNTVFVGGGTPTVLTPAQLTRLTGAIRDRFPYDADELEFTVEANPGTTDADKLDAMRAGGVNRISFGVQAFDDGLLRRIGRIHNTDDVYRSIGNARKAGFTNLSLDLMFGLPEQTLEQLDDSISAALALELPHYSVYSLKVEENTLFHTLYQRNELPLPSEETELEMYLLLMKRMKAAGYKQYEISNFALPGRESRHNTAYWRNQSYYGLGAGAHGYTRGVRHVNVKGVQAYIDAAAGRKPMRIEIHEVGPQEAMEDFMMVGLRLLDGVRDADFRAQFGRSLDSVFSAPLKQLQEQRLLERTADGYRLSDRGILFGNDVFAAFLG